MKNKILLINKIKKVFLYKKIKVLGWATTKLYNDDFYYKFKLFMYSLLYCSQAIIEKKSNSNKKNNILIFYGNYISSSKNAQNILSSFNSIIKLRFNVTCSRIINKICLKSTIKKIFFLCKTYSEIQINDNLFNKILYCAIYSKGIIEIAYYTKILDKYKYKKTLIINYCDAIGEENLIAQISKKLNLKTVTFQHGQYNISKKKFISPDDEAYNNFVSDIMFCWGEETIRELTRKNIPKKKFFVTGLIDNKKKNRLYTYPKKRNFFGVILSGENQKKFNLDLINFSNKLSKKINCNYIIRLHPSNRKDEILKQINNKCHSVSYFKSANVEKYYNKCKFSIIGRSGVYLELLEQKQKFVFYDNGSLPKILKNSGLYVNKIDEVLSNLKKFNSKSIYKKLSYRYNDNYNQEKKILKKLSELCMV